MSKVVIVERSSTKECTSHTHTPAPPKKKPIAKHTCPHNLRPPVLRATSFYKFTTILIIYNFLIILPFSGSTKPQIPALAKQRVESRTCRSRCAGLRVAGLRFGAAAGTGVDLMKLSLGRKGCGQGDQIGRIRPLVFFLWAVLLNDKSSPHFWATLNPRFR
jgi:hypothetical protein